MASAKKGRQSMALDDDPLLEAAIKRARELFKEVLPDEELNKNFEWECSRVEDFYKQVRKKDARHWPEMSIVLKCSPYENIPPEQVLMVLGVMPKDPEERHMMFFGAGAKIAEMHKKMYPVMTTFVSEAWSRSGAEKVKEMIKADKRVKDYEDRKETVIVFTMAIDKRIAFASYFVERDDKGIITGLKVHVKQAYDPKALITNESPLLTKFYEGFTMANIERWLKDKANKPQKVGKES